MKKNFSYKVSSALMCAAMAGTTVATPIMSSVSATTDEQVGQEVMQDGATGQVPTDIAVSIDSSTASVTFDGTQTLESFVQKLLAMTGVEMTDEAVRMDWVGADGFRNSIRTGDAEADAAQAIQTMGDYCEFVKSEGRAVTLVVFTDATDIARIVISELEDGSMFVDVEKGTPEVSYLVRYDANGGQLEGNDFVLRANGEKLSYIETSASYDRHAFDGWYDAKEGGNKVDENTLINSNMRVYAHWIADTYRVDFDTQGGNTIESQMISVDESLYNLPTPEKEGATFLGWYDAAEGGNKVISVKTPEDTVLYAHWDEAKQDVTPDDDTTDVPEDDGASDDNTNSENPDDTDSDGTTDDGAGETEAPTVYKLYVTTSNGSFVNVSVKSTVSLSKLVHKLGYTDAVSYKVRKADGSEIEVNGKDSVANVAVLADEGDIELIAFDANNVAIGSAVITKNEATGKYDVSLKDVEDDTTTPDDTETPDDGTTSTPDNGADDDTTNVPDDGNKDNGTTTVPDDGNKDDGTTTVPDVSDKDNTTDNDTVQEDVSAYKLVITTATGGIIKVGVKSNLQLNTLVYKLGYTNAASYVANGSAVGGDTTIKALAEMADAGELVLKVYDASNTEIGTAKVVRNSATGDYDVTLTSATSTVPDSGDDVNPNDQSTVVPETPSDTDNTDNTTVEEVATYKLGFTNTDGSSMNVAVKSSVQLGTLVTKLGYTNAVYFSVKTVDGSETTVKSDVTMKELAEMADAGNILLIAYDAAGQPIGSVKIVSAGNGEYQVSLSKDTNVDLTAQTTDTTTDSKLKGADISDKSEVSGKGKGEGEDETADSVKTADMSVMPIFGAMGSVTTTLLGVFAAIKRRLS